MKIPKIASFPKFLHGSRAVGFGPRFLVAAIEAAVREVVPTCRYFDDDVELFHQPNELNEIMRRY